MKNVVLDCPFWYKGPMIGQIAPEIKLSKIASNILRRGFGKAICWSLEGSSPARDEQSPVLAPRWERWQLWNNGCAVSPFDHKRSAKDLVVYLTALLPSPDVGMEEVAHVYSSNILPCMMTKVGSDPPEDITNFMPWPLDSIPKQELLLMPVRRWGFIQICLVQTWNLIVKLLGTLCIVPVWASFQTTPRHRNSISSHRLFSACSHIAQPNMYPIGIGPHNMQPPPVVASDNIFPYVSALTSNDEIRRQLDLREQHIWET